MAVKDFEEGIRLSPKDGIVYNNLALFRSSCPNDNYRNGKQAVELSSKACKLTHWKSWFCIATLAAAYAETGDFAKAIEYQKMAMEMFGANKQNRDEGYRRLDLYLQGKPYRRDLKSGVGQGR